MDGWEGRPVNGFNPCPVKELFALHVVKLRNLHKYNQHEHASSRSDSQRAQRPGYGRVVRLLRTASGDLQLRSTVCPISLHISSLTLI